MDSSLSSQDSDIFADVSPVYSSVTATALPQVPSNSSTQTQVGDVDDPPVELTSNTNNRTYLITYSQVDKDLAPTRQIFADLCVDAFGGVTKVEQYACAEEPHENGGTHYHVSLKLLNTSRWFRAKEYLRDRGIIVNFARPPPGRAMYAWIFRYISKFDENVHLSENHPHLEDIVNNNRCRRAVAARVRAAADSRGDGGKRSSRLKDPEVAKYCRKHGLKSLSQLMADAEERMKNGDESLHDYIFSRTLKQLHELLAKVDLMEKCVEKVLNLGTPRMETLRSFKDADCVDRCESIWYDLALDIFRRSAINKYVFADGVRELIEKGRARGRNVLILGPHAAGKTFLLKPLMKIFPIHFVNPAASAFGWIGADEASFIMLNDFRWLRKSDGGNIEWTCFLNLLEGMTVSLPAPMNHYSKHISIHTDVPIFATGPDPIRWYSRQENEPRDTTKHKHEDQQMEDRWNIFRLSHTFERGERRDDIPPCPSCFARLAFLGYGD